MITLEQYLNPYSHYVHHIRGEKINVPCLVLSIFNIEFWRGRLMSAYTSVVLKFVNPKVVLTFIDNNPVFYTISNQSNKLKTVFIQNGWRGGGSDIFYKLKPKVNYYVDFKLVFNPEIGREYESYVKGNTIVLGSLKNNIVEKITEFPDQYKKNTVLFISAFREFNYSYTDSNNKKISFDDFYRHDFFVIKWLAKWCAINGKKIFILGASEHNSGSDEEPWYGSILNGMNVDWEYSPRSSPFDTYNKFNLGDIIVTAGSTIAYEAFGRGKKTAFLTGRSELLGDEQRKFGWPGNFPETGPFWSNVHSETHLVDIMSYLTNVSDKEWKLMHAKYKKSIMEVNYGNSKLIKLLKQIV